jgi:hypothetical protein
MSTETGKLTAFLQVAVPTLRIEWHPPKSRVRILVGGFRGDTGKVSDVRNGLHFLSMDSGITLGGYAAWQLEAVE